MLIHDPAVLTEDPGLLEAVGSVARLALANERLAAQVRAQLEEVRASRARIVDAADAERRRVERDLHDGAQQRLLAVTLRLDQARASGELDPALLDEATAELRAAIGEVRDLSRGLHPTILAEAGLGAAIESLAERTPVPVVVEASDQRFPPSVEAAAYFVVAEALTNVARYASASRVVVGIRAIGDDLEVTVTDDGRGAPTRGGGAGCGACPTGWARSAGRWPSTARRAPGPRSPHACRWGPGADDARIRSGPGSPAGRAIRVALADDAVLLREALATSLAHAGFEVVGGAGDATGLLELVEAHDPDVVVLDVRMPPTFTTEGLQLARDLRASRPSLGILVLSQYVETRYAVELVRDDARGLGYLLKDRVTRVADLVDAVERVAAGGTVIDPEVVGRLLGRPRTHSPLDELTRREREVLGLMAEGLSNQGIADRLGLELKTVEGHVGIIFSKLGLDPASTEHRRVRAVLAWLRDPAG